MGDQKWADDKFGKRLKLLRTRKGWTQAQLAEKLSANGIHLTPAQLARIEKDQRSLRAVEAAAFADLYKLSMDALLSRRARPKADLMDALRGALDTKEQTRWSVSSAERTLREAAETLAAADPDSRYAEFVADCENACKALDAASQIVASIGDKTNPQTRAAIREGTTRIMRQWLDEQEADK